MKKTLPDDVVQLKNMAELARHHRITDPETLAQLFQSVDPDRTFSVQLEEMRGGGGVARQVTIGTYDMSLLHDRACVIFVAPRESGKTVFTYQMVATKSYFPTGYVTSTTDGASGYYQTVFPPERVRFVYDPQYQMRIIDAQNRAADLYREELQKGRLFDPRVIVIEDDCAYDRHMHEDASLDRVGTSGRHFQIFSIVCVQRLQRVSPTFRDNCDLIVLFANDNEHVRREVWKEYGSSVSYASFVNMWDTITSEPYYSFVIACRGRDRYKNPEQRFFAFKAYLEEAVDAILGGGEADSKTGEVLVPPRHLWQFGKPPPDDKADQIEIEGQHLVDGREDEPDTDIFEPSPASITEHMLAKRRDARERAKADALSKAVGKNSE